MWSDWLVLCEYCFSLSALWCPPTTPTILFGFLLPWRWGISSQLLQQSTAATPYLGRVAPPDLERRVAPLSPPAPIQPPILGRGVAPLVRSPWPWTWNSSYWLPSLTLDVGSLLSSMNQGKLEVVKQDMARMNIDILGISELKWTGMGEFNSDDHYISYCGQESLRRNGVAIMVNKRVQNAVLGCNPTKDRMISVCF